MRVIVTGASRGIGQAIVKRLLEDGHAVVFSYLGSQERAEATVADLKAQGLEQVLAVKADVTKEADCENLVQVASEFFGGPVEALVNNAGINNDNLLIKMTEEDFTEVLATNLVGPFLMSKAVIRPMMKARQGRIVNMSSVAGLHGNAGQANYAAAKAGLVGLTKTLAKEYASRNILVNAVAPGLITTEMTEAMPKKAKDLALGQIGLGRMGEVEEIAGVVSFLLSPDSTYLTGQVLEVSGGLVI